MRLKTLGCKYFMSFGDWNEMRFSDDQQIVSIVGEWFDEPKRSNRSGKSTFVEAIIYALYGKSRSKKEIDLINKNFPDEDMIVELTFENDDANEIVIQRGRTSTNQIILELTGFEGADKKVIQEEIDRIVGLNYSDFIMTSFFLQGDIHTFMEAGATGQKQVIAKWLEKEYWKAFEKRSKELQSDIQKEIEHKNLIASDKPSLDRDGEIKNDISYLNIKKSDLEKVLDRLKNNLDDLNNQLNKADEIRVIKIEVSNLNKQKIKFDKEIDRYNEIILKLNNELPEAEERERQLQQLDNLKNNADEFKKLQKEAEDEYYKKQSEVARLDASRNSLLNYYNQLKDFDNICPVMKKQCESISAIDNSKEDVIKQGRKAANDLKKCHGELTLLEQKVKDIKKKHMTAYEDYRNIKALEKLPQPSSIKSEIEYNKTSIKTAQEFIDETIELLDEKNKKLQELENIDIDNLKSQKRENKNEIRVKNEELNDIINNVASLNAELNQIKDKRKKAIDAEKQIKILTEKLNKYKLVTYMFSKNGIPSNQVEVAFNEIEEEANIILEKINSDISIEFSPDRELKTWEENCLICNTPFPKGYRKIECPECSAERQKKKKDELNITIKTQNKEMDFNLESGGGKVLISLAIRLAFVRMLQRRLGVNLKLIVFDEVFGMLDNINRSSVFKLLTTTLINDFGFSQIFAISHEEEIRDVIPDVIKVVKYQDYSEFNWG